MAACVAGIAGAVEVNAKVYFEGSLAQAGNNADDDFVFSGIKLNNTNQKDADALVFDISGERAGAHFQAWYSYTGAGTVSGASVDDLTGDNKSPILKVRSTSIWVKPIDMLKITAGDVSLTGYTERIEWWKTPTGASADDFNEWKSKFSNYNTVEGAGFGIELYPVEGLSITGGFTPGTDNWWASSEKGYGLKPYGVAVKYDLNGAAGVPVTVTVSWRDAGNFDTNAIGDKILAIGADYNANGLYAFLNARMNFAAAKDHGYWDDVSQIWRNDTYMPEDQYGTKLRGIVFDNYISYSTGPLTIQACFPITIRGLVNYDTDAEKDADPSYMIYRVKASYSLGAYTPYVYIWDDDAVQFGKDSRSFGDTFKLNARLGTTFSIDKAGFDVGFQLDGIGKDQKPQFSIPFNVGVSF